MKILSDSIQWRIFLYYTAILTTAVALLSAAHYWAELRSAQRLAEGQMQELGIYLLPLAFPPPDMSGVEPPEDVSKRVLRRGPVESTGFHRKVEELTQRGFYVVAVNWHGEEVFRSSNSPRDFLVHGPSGGPFTLTPDSASLGAEVRSIVGDVIALGQSRKSVDLQALKALPPTVALAVLVLGGFSLLGFRLIAHGLKPIREISRTAGRIANGNFSERIDVSAQSSELGQLADVLNNTFERLEEILLQQKQFIADASHELRTPVAAILADCEFSRKRSHPTERYQKTIEVCYESAQHMRKVIEDLGILARFDVQGGEAQKAACDLAESAANALALACPLAENQGIALLPSLAPAPCRANASRLDQVALNLLSNAILYNRPKGEVRVRTGCKDRESFLEVEDTGPGIPADKHPLLFHRFYRLDETRAKTPEGGTGLGLAICKAIVEAYGGRIELASTMGQGSIFRVSFPTAGHAHPAESSTG